MDYIGIDPGLKGAIAFIAAQGATVEVRDTPTASYGKKNDYVIGAMAQIVKTFKTESTGGLSAIIEAVHAMPKQGVSSSFNFGKGYGLWLGILAALDIPFETVTPQRWKGPIMRGMSDKNSSRIKAAQLYPSISATFARKKDDGRAEAVLIAHYGVISGIGNYNPLK